MYEGQPVYTAATCRDGLPPAVSCERRPSVRASEPATAAQLKAELDRLEAERAILTIELDRTRP
jgi:hypothetical protein